MFSVETGQMSAVDTGQMSAAETGQMSAVETGQMSAVETQTLQTNFTSQRREEFYQAMPRPEVKTDTVKWFPRARVR